MSVELPTTSIQKATPPTYDGWFDYPIRVQPHHTDYSGAVWHGAYIAFLEAARVECLRSLGIHFENLVALGYHLPVVELSIRYQRALFLGDRAVVKSRITPQDGIRINWEQNIFSPDGRIRHMTAQVVNVPVDRATGKILRRLPPDLKDLSTLSRPNPT